MCPMTIFADELDYSKFSGEIREIFPAMKDGEKATVLLYLSYDKYIYDVSEDEIEALYNEREAENRAFFQRYPSITEDNIYYVSKYSRQVAVNATKAELTRFWCDSEVKSITDFKMNLGFSNGMTGADVKYALDEYIASKNAIDSVGAYLENVGESNDIPLLHYIILPTADEVRPIRIDNYIFVANSCSMFYDLGYYAIVDGKFVTFEKTLEEGLVNIDEAADIYNSAYKIENLGDMTGDGKVDVKDATCLQKGLAGLVEMPKVTFDFEDFRNYDVTDFNADGKINIRDATAIQKYVAKIDC